MSYEIAVRTPHGGSGRYTALVLADAGSDMWLVRARFTEPPDVGSRFTFKDREWRLIWRCAQGFGARPESVN